MSVLIVAVCGVFGALWLPSIMPLWILSQALVLSGVLVPTYAAWFWKRSTKQGAICSCIFGFIASFSWAMYAWVTTDSPGTLIGGFHAAHIGLIVSIPTMIIVSLLTKADYEAAEITNFKRLGECIRNEETDASITALTGVWRFLGADKGYLKVIWVILAIFFLAHFLLILGFSNHAIGNLAVWMAIVTGLIMFLIYTFMPATDVKKLIPRKK